jgi:uncharacterized lipoprotein YbaY
MVPQSPEEPEICPQATQIRNDPGLAYLLEALAADGAIAFAPDVNTVFRAEFGGLVDEAQRIQFVVERHLEHLAAGNPAFALQPGVAADRTRLYIIGHSRGGFGAFRLATNWAEPARPASGWSPARGLLLVAPLVPQSLDFAPPLDVPFAVVLPECDGDVAFLEGQHYTEAARLDPNRRSPAATYFVRGANHNFFNTALDVDDGRRVLSRCLPDTPRLPAGDQQRFLAALAPALLQAWEAGAVDAIPGFDPAAPVPTELFGVSTLTVPVRPAAQRTLVLPGISSRELSESPLGGAVSVEQAVLDFCPYGMVGNGSTCRNGVEVPGTPAQLHLAWETGGTALRIALATGTDVPAASALQLRLALDPLDRRSPAGQVQRLRIVLRDSAGSEAAQIVEAGFPPGAVVRDGWFGHVFPTTLRLPLASFAGVEPARLVALELRPESPSGALFLADLELVSDDAGSGTARPSPNRSLTGVVTVPELSELPEGSSLIVRLLVDGGDPATPRFVTIQSTPVAGALPVPFELRYHQAAIDERADYMVDAILQLPDGQSFIMETAAPAIVGGVPQQGITLALAPVVFTEPTPVPTDAVFRLTVQSPVDRPLPSGALVTVVLSRLDAAGVGVDTIAVAEITVDSDPADSVEIELPYASAAIVPDAPHGVNVTVFAADGFTNIANTPDNQTIDLATGQATVRLTAAVP